MTDEYKKEKLKDLMNRISFVLKDETLQQGFEIICKRISELEKENNELKQQLDNLQVAYTLTVDKSVIREQELEDHIGKLEAENSSKDECIDNLEHDLKDAGGELELWQRENVELKKENKQLKDQITDIKEDVERERNKQRRLEHDFTTDILNNLLNKWS